MLLHYIILTILFVRECWDRNEIKKSKSKNRFNWPEIVKRNSSNNICASNVQDVSKIFIQILFIEL